ncbi:RING-type domain-containing protein [Nephila pilipes]|uniref:RING-type domain-containing protein n=1 Tax=Nephila pilipes TaxID=299642 RepID=A0A8X6QGR9_NEPPI|nr:RING-type domain-containing protein [Nephila pilipes]
MKKTVHLLSVPFRKIKEELSEEQVALLQKELSAEKMKRVCIICHDRERNVLLYPCRHMIMCVECTMAVQESFQNCPLCRNEILNTLQVYT